MRIFAGDLSLPEFRWLIEHAGWQALSVPPGEDVQGLDVRQWIGKDGVVFSAYPIPRGSSVFGSVSLEPPPEWAKSARVACTITVEELLAKTGLDSGEEGPFRSLNRRLDDVKAYLRSDDFARARLTSEITLLGRSYDSTRSVLRQSRNEIGIWRMMRGLAKTYVAERRQLARYRQALKSLDVSPNGATH
jgi:hypothetical protein